MHDTVPPSSSCAPKSFCHPGRSTHPPSTSRRQRQGLCKEGRLWTRGPPSFLWRLWQPDGPRPRCGQGHHRCVFLRRRCGDLRAQTAPAAGLKLEAGIPWRNSADSCVFSLRRVSPHYSHAAIKAGCLDKETKQKLPEPNIDIYTQDRLSCVTQRASKGFNGMPEH